MIELSITQACSAPANFLYVWADEKGFLSKIETKYANKIRIKKANEIKLLVLSAEKFRTTYEAYVKAIKEAFVRKYQMQPEDALIKLAMGETVCDINWSEGVFGIGKTYPTTYQGYPEITVDVNTGHILDNGTDITDTSKTTYVQLKKYGAYASQLFAIKDGVTFVSQLIEKKRQYYALYSVDTNGERHDATTGAETNGETSSIWGDIQMDFTWFQNVINWILSLFGVTIPTVNTINTENTLPNQKADGFAQKDPGVSEAAVILLALVAGGTLVAGGIGSRKKK